MTVITFDTLKFVDKLKHSGIPEKHAKAISEAFRDSQSETEVATRRDLRELEHRLNTKFISLESRMLAKFGAMLTAAVSIIVVLQKLF